MIISITGEPTGDDSIRTMPYLDVATDVLLLPTGRDLEHVAQALHHTTPSSTSASRVASASVTTSISSQRHFGIGTYSTQYAPP